MVYPVPNGTNARTTMCGKATRTGTVAVAKNGVRVQAATLTPCHQGRHETKKTPVPFSVPRPLFRPIGVFWWKTRVHGAGARLPNRNSRGTM